MFLNWKSKLRAVQTLNRATLWELICRLPLTAKLTAWYSLFLFLMLLLLSIFIVQFTHMWEDTEMRRTLQDTVMKTVDSPRKFRPLQNGVYSVIYTEEGVVISGAVPENFPLESLQSPNRITEITIKNMTYYYYDAEIHTPSFNGWIRGIVPMNTLSHKTNTILLALLLGGIAFLLIGAIGGYLLVKRGLKPVRLITRTAIEIGQQRDLSKRIPLTPYGNDELYTLTTTFNDMLNSLEEYSLRQRQFNSDVSHELRTPIAVIQAESDYSRRYTESVEEAKESFNNIFEQSKLMTSIIAQLLEIARLDNLQKVELNHLDIAPLLEEVCQTMQNQPLVDDLRFTYKIEPDLPVMGRAVLLRQAVNNLLDNAKKFTKHTISLQAYREDKNIVIAVKDDGMGIAEEDLDKIWNRLYQAEASRNKTNNNGLGLGLYFVKKVASLHQATITVESHPGAGATFTLHIPLAP